ncbi:hypothetical protein BCR37DRAFT_378885 [Protomyces lactucae-debilis]|uniref:Uncharacterized protein n=1 Tax=Protomyces lactucae-debilis TaxID=2754530 RepID=A0A1Y2FIS9_PROLT|nr:uncharacterized protein BCR37DRAFT_378885 [Protomyces lactucae-debilis]ORY83872.1 hypothetical protein BCR37DRAFT_378885 [Protomyces lactucae-debilis]
MHTSPELKQRARPNSYAALHDDEDERPHTPASDDTPRARKRKAKPKTKRVAVRDNAPPSALSQLAWSAVSFTLDILGRVLTLLKWPIAFVLCLFIGRFAFYKSLSLIVSTVQYQTRASICALPLASNVIQVFAPEFCQPAAPIDFASLVNMQKSAVSVPTYSGSMPLQLKKAELATRDLRAVLQASELSCKDTLDAALGSFGDHSRVAGRAIQQTVVRTNGLLDASLATNEWAIKALNQIETNSGLTGMIPFAGSMNTREGVRKTYVAAMNFLSEELKRLVLSNDQASLALENLEEDLHTISSIMELEKQLQTEERQSLSSLWSLLGGNRAQKRLFKSNMATLQEFEADRKHNRELVARTSVALDKMIVQVEEFRDKVARPGLLDDEIPIELHLNAIRMGVDELRGAKTLRQEAESEASLLD